VKINMKKPLIGVTCSPLIVGDRVLVSVGDRAVTCWQPGE